MVENCFCRKCHLFTPHHKDISGEETLLKSVLDLNLFDVFINESGDRVRNKIHSADKSGLEWLFCGDGMRIQKHLNK